MKRIWVAIIVLLFFMWLPSQARASQVSPQQGVNCGVGWYKGDINNPQDLRDAPPQSSQLVSGGDGEKFACCYSVWNNVKFEFHVGDFIKSVGSNIPVVGGVVGGIQNILPGGSPNDLPLFGGLVSAFEGIVNNAFNMGEFFLGAKNVPNADINTLTTALSNIPYCERGSEAQGDPNSNSCYCKAGASPALKSLVGYCDFIQNASEKADCQKCLGYVPGKNGQIEIAPGLKAGQTSGTFSQGGVWTSMGCIQTSLKGFIEENLLSWGISLGFLVALGCIIIAAFQMQISAGSPERIKKTQEMLTSCIMGLMLIIFSVFILRLIGVNILRLPGFS